MFQSQRFGYPRDAQQLTVASICCVLPCLKGTRCVGNVGIRNQLLHSSVKLKYREICHNIYFKNVIFSISNLSSMQTVKHIYLRCIFKYSNSKIQITWHFHWQHTRTYEKSYLYICYGISIFDVMSSFVQMGATKLRRQG
jgi:hypothetical protein